MDEYFKDKAADAVHTDGHYKGMSGLLLGAAPLARPNFVLVGSAFFSDAFWALGYRL